MADEEKPEVIGRAWVRIELLATGHYDMQSFMDGDPAQTELAPIANSELGRIESARQAGYVANLYINLFKASLTMFGTIAGIMEFVGRMMPITEIYQRIQMVKAQAEGIELPPGMNPDDPDAMIMDLNPPGGDKMEHPTTDTVKLRKRGKKS